MSNGEVILYIAEDGSASIQLRMEGGSVWLTQLEMAELFQTTKQNISLHVKNILADGEQNESVVKEHLTTASDGKKYRTKIFSLNMILAVGYRVASHRGTQFRQWATSHLQEYLIKGFVMDDARLKTPGGNDYFDAFLTFNEKDLLNHAGKISAQVAEKLVLERYVEFDTHRRKAERLADDAKDMQALEALEVILPRIQAPLPPNREHSLE